MHKFQCKLARVVLSSDLLFCKSIGPLEQLLAELLLKTLEGLLVKLLISVQFFIEPNYLV